MANTSHLYAYDSFNPLCKQPFGAVKAGSTVMFSILLTDFSLPRRVELLLYRADEFGTPAIRAPLEIDTVRHAAVGTNRYVCHVRLPDEPQLYFYCFEVEFEGAVRTLRRIDSHNGDFAAEGELWQLTCYSPDYYAPEPPTRGIIYQIFPDRFCRSGMPKEGVPPDRKMHGNWDEGPDYRPNEQGIITNSDYFGGDLRGIAMRLPYLKSLGVSLIYLNPIFEAHSNHRYNVADYFKVDPLLGTNDDFRRLCEQAAEQGIGIVLDGVFSHTGSDSVYFNMEGRYGSGGAYRDPESPFRSWYKFEEYPHRYHSWWGFTTLPEIIEENPDFLEFICGEQGVIRYWMRLGAAGFRLDVADELPDVILERIREAVKAENSDGILIGEVWEDASNKIAYSQRRRYLLGRQLDSAMNYPFMNAVLRYVRYGDYGALYHGVLTILENYPSPSQRLLFNSLSTHDTVRAITMLAGEEYTGGDREWQAQRSHLSDAQYARGRSLLLIAYTLLYFLPGIPCLYYGDEAGVCGWRDPFNRATYPWGREDQWLIEAFRKLGRLYRLADFLPRALFIPFAGTTDVFAYSRSRRFVDREDDRALLVVVNRGEMARDLSGVLPGRYEAHVITGSFENGVLAPMTAVVMFQ